MNKQAYGVALSLSQNKCLFSAFSVMEEIMTHVSSESELSTLSTFPWFIQLPICQHRYGQIEKNSLSKTVYAGERTTWGKMTINSTVDQCG